MTEDKENIIEFEETIIESSTIDLVETIEVVNPIEIDNSPKGEGPGEPEPSSDTITPRKYVVDDATIDNYLKQVKPSDTVMQESRGGNFISTRNRNTIYIPLDLIKV